MPSLDEHIKALRKAEEVLGINCPWLGESQATGSYTKYGEKGALCIPSQKVAAGRAASSAYQNLRQLEFDHLSKVREILKEALSRRRDLDEETSRYLAKDLFEKCEEIAGCIDCSCDSAVAAYHNLNNLLDILTDGST